MIRSFPVLAFAFLLLAACSTSKPAPPIAVDPATDPSIIGAVGEAAVEGSVEAEAAAQTGRRIGRVAGVLAAVFGGPETESLDDVVDRYRRTRDAAEATGAIIGATKGATAGAKRGFEFDLQFAALHQIDGLDVVRPFPDQIDVRFAGSPSRPMLAKIAAVFAGGEERAIDIEAPGRESLDIRDSLTELGLRISSITVRRNDDVRGVVLRIRLRHGV